MKYNYYMDRFSHRTRDGLIEHAKSLRKPGIDYFLKYFHGGTGFAHSDEDSEVLKHNLQSTVAERES